MEGLNVANIFISHSKRDKELVITIEKILKNIGHTPIIEEFIPEENMELIPYEEIRKNVDMSDYVFLFLTDNIIKTEFTHNWVSFEVGVAANARKRLFVFERLGVPVPYPIPYLTDYMVFAEDDINEILNIQLLSKKLKETSKTLKGAGIGALIGIPFGPLGLIVGSSIGYLCGARSQKQTRKIYCPKCQIFFNYHSLKHTKFGCPSCRNEIILNMSGE